MVILGGETLGIQLTHECGGLLSGVKVPIKRDVRQDCFSLPCEDTMKDSYFCIYQEEPLPELHEADTFILD